jgi:serine/threonine-protein kinase RsbW
MIELIRRGCRANGGRAADRGCATTAGRRASGNPRWYVNIDSVEGETALGLDQDTEQDLVLAVNEAACNAIEHAYPSPGPGDQITVSFWTEPRHLNVEVADRGRWRQPDADCGHRGRGILIMGQMVESMSIHKDPDGTRVRLRHPHRPEAPTTITVTGPLAPRDPSHRGARWRRPAAPSPPSTLVAHSARAGSAALPTALTHVEARWSPPHR